MRWASLEGDPVRFTETRAYIYIRRPGIAPFWKRLHIADAVSKAGLLDRDTYRRMFGTLPPVPIAELEDEAD